MEFFLKEKEKKRERDEYTIIKVGDFVLGAHLLKKKRHRDRTKSIGKNDYTKKFQVCVASVEMRRFLHY